MTTFKNTVNAFGNSAGDDMSKNSTTWKGAGTSFPKGKLKRYPAGAGDISSGNRRLAKAKLGKSESGTSFCGKNAFSRSGKGK
jgi:hypothetical protein